MGNEDAKARMDEDVRKERWKRQLKFFLPAYFLFVVFMYQWGFNARNDFLIDNELADIYAYPNYARTCMEQKNYKETLLSELLKNMVKKRVWKNMQRLRN